MTQQVRTSYRNHRKATWAAVLVVLVVAALAIVPVVASQTGPEVPYPSDPLGAPAKTWSTGGGGTFTCSAVSSAAGNTFFLSSPVSGTYQATASNGQTVTIGITIPSSGPQSVKGKYLSFKIIGGSVRDIGIKGGTTVATYAYGSTPTKWAQEDGYGSGSSGTLNTSTGKIENLAVDTDASNSKTGLHAPRDNQGTLYNISQLTMCYEPTIKIEGYVYRDSNGNHEKDEGESGLGGRTVNLSDGSVATSSSASSTLGLYQAFVPPGTYTLCSSADVDLGEVQTQPAPSDSCSGAGGWTDDYTSDTSDQNFGFTGGVEGACGTSTSDPLQSRLESGDATVVAKFLSVNGVCKVAGSNLVFTTYTENGARFAMLSPVGSLGTATCSLSTGTGCQIVAEMITWNLQGTSPDTNTLRYDDPPYDPEGDTTLMQFCKKDPLDHTAPDDGVTLKAVGLGYYPADILPTGETSCLIKTTQGPGPNPKRVDQVYSGYDGKVVNGN